MVTTKSYLIEDIVIKENITLLEVRGGFEISGDTLFDRDGSFLGKLEWVEPSKDHRPFNRIVHLKGRTFEVHYYHMGVPSVVYEIEGD